MLWLVIAIVLGVVIGLIRRPSSATLLWLDRSLVVSLVVMLFGLGLQVGGNPKLSQALDKHVFSVLTLVIAVGLVSLAWGWWLGKGGCKECPQ